MGKSWKTFNRFILFIQTIFAGIQISENTASRCRLLTMDGLNIVDSAGKLLYTI